MFHIDMVNLVDYGGILSEKQVVDVGYYQGTAGNKELDSQPSLEVVGSII